jgi:hypothetical protein
MGGKTLRPDRTGDRQHSIADLLILLSTVALAVATWSSLSGAAGVAVWKSVTGVAVTLLLALGALTRNPNWAAAIRVLTGLWLIAAPYLLDFNDMAPALRIYLTVGATVTAMGIAGHTVRHADYIRFIKAHTGPGIPWNLANASTNVLRQ